MVTIVHDFYIVELEQIWDVERTKSKIITLNDAHIDSRAKNDDWERNKFKRIYGTLIRAPRGFSGQRINPVETGSPQPRIYIGHDLIQEKINEGFDWNNRNYHPGMLDNFQFTTTEDYGNLVDAKEGERVFVNPMALEPDHFIGTGEGGKPHFKVRVDDILGAGSPVRGQGGWVWVYPEKETWEELTTDSGIITKSSLGYKKLRGKLSTGESIYFQTNSEWPFMVDGVEMYCTESENVLCVIE